MAACLAGPAHAGTDAANTPAPPAVHERSTPLVAVLCYHDVSDDSHAPAETVSPSFLRHQIEACRAAGWTFVPLAELVAKHAHPEQLPPRTMVLTFDGGFESFRSRALPVLRQANVPAAVAVCTAAIERTPPGGPRLMTWRELAEIQRQGVEVVSLAHELCHRVSCNPDGDLEPAAVTRRYDSHERRYETLAEYRSRVGADLAQSQRTLKNELGKHATVLAWPEGRDNDVARDVAKRAGFHATLVRAGGAVTAAALKEGRLPRISVTRGTRFDEDLAWLAPAPAPMRAAEVDLDDLYDADGATFEGRIAQLVRRLDAMNATDAFVTVCSDPQSDGRLDGAYVAGAAAPLRAEAFSHVAARIAASGIAVWARVPTLDLTWAWNQHSDWRVRRDAPARPRAADDSSHDAELPAAAPGDSAMLAALPGVSEHPWPTRLSPELPGARRAAAAFVSDIATYAPIDGVVFDDDAFLTATERLADGRGDAGAKARAIDGLLDGCRTAARAWRPECRFARRLDASTVELDGVHPALAQDFDASLRNDDLTIVTAYPWMNGKDGTAASDWIESIGERAAARSARIAAAALTGASAPPRGAVLLEIQTYDWLRDAWLPSHSIAAMAMAARKSGVTNFGLCPVAAHDGEIPTGLLSGTPATVASDEARSGK